MMEIIFFIMFFFIVLLVSCYFKDLVLQVFCEYYEIVISL